MGTTIFIFSKASRLTLASTQTPIPWLSGIFHR